MKIIKYFLLLIFVILIGGIVYVALLDGQFTANGQLKIKAPRSLVFQQINHLNTWKNWATGVQIDSSSKKVTGEGASISWRQDSTATTGEIITTSVIHYATLKQKGTAQQKIGSATYQLIWNFDYDYTHDSTLVSLQIKGNLDYWAKVMHVLKGKPLQPKLQPLIKENLHRFKAYILHTMAVFSIHIDGIAQTQPKTYIYSSLATRNKPEIIAEKRKKVLKKLRDFLSKNKIKDSGAPFMLFNTIDHQHHNVIITIGIPITQPIQYTDSTNSILIGSLPAHRVIKSTLKGNYKNIAKLWEAIKVYMLKNNLQVDETAHPYEVFRLSSKASLNPADWVTQLYIPIKEETETSVFPTDIGVEP